MCSRSFPYAGCSFIFSELLSPCFQPLCWAINGCRCSFMRAVWIFYTSTHCKLTGYLFQYVAGLKLSYLATGCNFKFGIKTWECYQSFPLMWQESEWAYFQINVKLFPQSENLKNLCLYDSQVLYSSWVPWCKTVHRSHPRCSKGPRTAAGQERSHVSTRGVNRMRKDLSAYLDVFSLKHVWTRGKIRSQGNSFFLFMGILPFEYDYTDNTTIQLSELTLIHTRFVTHTLIDHRLSSRPHTGVRTIHML